jgi:hypothetical protein
MNIKTLSVVAVVTAALIVPAFAQYHHVRGHGYHGTAFRGAYNRLPAPVFYNAGPEYTPVCPGLARGIDCRIWPPPIDEDPDRKRGGGGGG